MELAELETNVLEFQHKSFSFERVATLDGTELAVFSRRETETESKFRPKVIRLFVVVPIAQVVYDLAADLLLIAPDGATPGPRGVGVAAEAAAGTTEFNEQGLAWRRVAVPSGLAYSPAVLAPALERPVSLAALGLGGPP